MSNAAFLPTPLSYPDYAAVLAGLSRMRNDFHELAEEVDSGLAAMALAMQTPGGREGARRALENQQAQLVWLAADTGAMLAALAEMRENNPMPKGRIRHSTITTPVLHLYNLAESLRHLGATLPEPCAGLALLLRILSEELKQCAEELDDSKQ